MGKLEFWFEFASTYSYPAAARIVEEAAARDVEIVWRPFLLGPIFVAQGWAETPFKIYPAKGRYMWRDVERICARLSLPFTKPSVFPRNGLLAARIAAAHAQAPWLPAFVRAVYEANFVHDREISDPDVLAAILKKLGILAEPVFALAGTLDAKSRLRTLTEEASSKGIFGAPSFLVGDELFWGGDRLVEAVDCAALDLPS